jgi:hypothetical protein
MAACSAEYGGDVSGRVAWSVRLGRYARRVEQGDRAGMAVGHGRSHCAWTNGRWSASACGPNGAATWAMHDVNAADAL